MSNSRNSKKQKNITQIDKRGHHKRTISTTDIKKSECEEFFQILSDFIDLELTENHLIQLRSHLTTCVRCTQVYREVRMLIQLCQSESIIEPTDVSSQLWQVLEKKFKVKRI